jgi:hypothetical protein
MYREPHPIGSVPDWTRMFLIPSLSSASPIWRDSWVSVAGLIPLAIVHLRQLQLPSIIQALSLRRRSTLPVLVRVEAQVARLAQRKQIAVLHVLWDVVEVGHGEHDSRPARVALAVDRWTSPAVIDTALAPTLAASTGALVADASGNRGPVSWVPSAVLRLDGHGSSLS